MYLSTGINDSPTIVRKVTGAIANGAFKAVKFDANGGIVTGGVAGEKTLGLLIATTPEAVAAGEDVTIQIKDIGLWEAGAAIKAGDELTTSATGTAAVAAAGNYVLAVALEAAAAPGAVIKIQIVKSGKVPA